MVKRALTLLTSILFALPLLMPFNIYANATHLVQTDYLSTVSSEWKNSMVFTSYCEGTNASTASCVLTVNITKSPKNYFGTVTIHGYDSSGTKWINYGDIFVSAGTGVYNYNFYQNGIKEISRVEVYSTNLIQPSSTVDLSQIISLLTSINSYNQQMEGNQDTQIQELQTIINDLIVSNGYLETLTKIKQWNFPIESYPYVSSFLYYNKNRIAEYYLENNYYKYPIFQVYQNDVFGSISSSANTFTVICFIGNGQAYDLQLIKNNLIDFKTYESEITNFTYWGATRFAQNNQTGYFVKFNINVNSYDPQVFQFKKDVYFIPIFFGDSTSSKNVSTEFALQYGLSNKLLDNLNKIANGTTASQSASSSSDLANEQLATESNTLFQQENGFKSDMQSAMQNVNSSFRLQDMGTKFVTSAQWVRTQYEHLTNNTPFASLITFSLISGLALILLGKVYK